MTLKLTLFIREKKIKLSESAWSISVNKVTMKLLKH